MARFGSRAKGRRLEMDACRLFTQWVFGIHFHGASGSDLPFRRCPNSGAFSKEDGDVRPYNYPNLARAWPFFVECKNREGWEWAPFMAGEKDNTVLGWWRDMVGKCPKELHRLLLFKKNNSPVFIVLSHYSWSQLAPLWPVDLPVFMALSDDYVWTKLSSLLELKFRDVSVALGKSCPRYLLKKF